MNSNEILTRSSHDISFYKNKLYVFGGENVARVPINNVMNIYDLESNKWECVETELGHEILK